MKNVWLLLGAALLLSVAPTAQAQTNPKHFFWAQGSPNAALPTEFPTATSGRICLADTRDLTGTTLFAQIAANCQAAGGVALLLIRDSTVNAPSDIPVFTISTTNGDFLRNKVGFSTTTGVSTRRRELM
jgi:hypothetical protein